MLDCHFELCAERLESAQAAEAGGADRIELCTELSIGGLTPPFDLVRAVVKSVSIPVHVLIRTRGGDFTPTEAEFDQMRRQVEMAKQAGAAGVVLGILHADRLHLRIRSAVYLYLAGDYRVMSRSLLCPFRRVGTYQRRLYHQASRRRPISPQSSLLRLQRDDHRSGASFPADIHLWILQRQARTALDRGCNPFSSGPRNGIYWVPASLGQERLLRHRCRNQHRWGSSLYRAMAGPYC